MARVVRESPRELSRVRGLEFSSGSSMDFAHELLAPNSQL